MRKAWTQEEEEILKKLHSKNISIEKMKGVFQDRTNDAIRNKLNSLGLGLPRVIPNINYDLYKELMEVEEV